MSFILVIFLLMLAFGSEDTLSTLKGIAIAIIGIILLLAVFNG